MKSENLVILNYQENFADNFTSLAYAKILENSIGAKYFYKNVKKERNIFENKMSDFCIDYNYISSATLEKLTRKANLYNREFIDAAKLVNIKQKFNKRKNKILDLKYFQIDDIEKLSDKTKEMFCFKNIDFVVNFDILEKITSQNSIGLYINKKDYLKDDINYEFIYKAAERLNKYVKKPKLYIFSPKDIQEKIKPPVEYEIISLWDWREEFYFLSNCKHKIITNSKNSYSEALWAAILNSKDYGLVIYDKNIKSKKKIRNWIAI